MKKQRLLLFSLWILALIAISLYGGAVSYGLFFCISLIPAISLLYLLSIYYTFNIYQEIQSRNITCRQPVPYHMALQNDSPFAFVGVSVRLFPQFSQVKELQDDTEFELYPGERHLLDTELLCKYRGEYEVGVREVILTDFFRVFRLHYKLPSTIKALVLPRVLQLETLRSIPDITDRMQKESVYRQNQPDIPVRDYLPGDSLKQIHWKASAKEQNVGWIPFEPTPGYDELRYTPWKLKQKSTSASTAAESDFPEEEIIAPEELSSETENTPAPAPWVWSTVLLCMLFLCVAAATFWLFEQIIRRRRYLRMAPAARLRIQVDINFWLLSKLGFLRADTETLSEFCRRIPAPCTFINTYEEILYGGQPVPEQIPEIIFSERKQLLALVKANRKLLYPLVWLRLKAYFFD